VEIFASLEKEAWSRMPELSLAFEYKLDLRYEGQGFHLTLPLEEDIMVQAARFEEAHEQAYGHRLQRPIEIMTSRLTAYADTPTLELPELPKTSDLPQAIDASDVHGTGRVPHFARQNLSPKHRVHGPVLVIEDTATLWMPDGWHLEVSPHGHLLLERK
jgi:N-methylhydantoinase A